jgi:prolyl-tRNA synthetase
MRWSNCFIPTLRENPAGIETIAERLLIRAGFIRAVSTGVYSYLPLGMRSFRKIQRIARGELEAIGGLEVALDESAAVEIARGELRGPRRQIWYRVHTDLLRLRQFTGLNVYWFNAERTQVEDALRAIIRHSGVNETGWVVLSDTGPDRAARCANCGYSAALDVALSRPAPAPPDVEGDLSPEPFHTPGQTTIADLSRFTGQPESMQMKSLVLVANNRPVLVMLRGDHQLSEAKFANRSGDTSFRQAPAEEIVKWFGASAGSLGPVGVTSMPVWMDTALEGRRNMICGANRDGYHLRHVTPGKDFTAEIADLREAKAGDGCVHCGAPLAARNAIELARVRDGAATLALDRLLIAAVEAGHDSDGMMLPRSIAPFEVVITAANTDAESIYQAFLSAGMDAILDDRSERPGVKFKDADLIGAPFRVTVGRKLSEGLVEVRERRRKAVIETPVNSVVVTVKNL